MASIGYIERALTGLHGYIESNFATYLRQIEVTNSLVVNSLLDPKEYKRGSFPIRNVSPMVQVFYVNDEPEDQRNRVFIVSMVIMLSFSGGNDLAANELRMNRYADAIYLCLVSDATLNATVMQALIGDGDADAEDESTSLHRHVISRTINARIQDR